MNNENKFYKKNISKPVLVKLKTCEKPLKGDIVSFDEDTLTITNTADGECLIYITDISNVNEFSETYARREKSYNR